MLVLAGESADQKSPEGDGRKRSSVFNRSRPEKSQVAVRVCWILATANLAAVMGLFVFAFLGAVAGVHYGGDYASRNEFHGMLGYEITG